MKHLTVSIERNGILVPVGSITGSSSADAAFGYAENYLQDPSSVPISLSLPLQKECFSPAQTAVFFEGLLPEGFTRRSVSRWMHASENDYLSILHGLGRECLGALCITEEGEKTEASYERIPAEQLRELAAEGALKSAELITRSRLSLTGASGKVGLYYDAGEKAWYLPCGTAPSTHIVKQSHIRLDSIVTNEQLSLMTAGRCGIPVPRSFIINTGSSEDRAVLFATERFDRLLQEERRISGLPCPFRLHQEDFAQALGIPSPAKYEDPSGAYLEKMAGLLRKHSADPIADLLQLWHTLVFNWLIGNTDAHIKNYSLLYSPDLKTIRLSPAYDLISTAVYTQSTREMAFRIGGASSIDEITPESFRQAAREIGLGERIAMGHFDRICSLFQKALHDTAEMLSHAGYPKALDLEARILRTGGIRHL